MKIILISICVLFINGCFYEKKISFPNQANDAELKELENQVLRLINEYRLALNLEPFKQSEILNFYARKHSQRMAEKKIPFGHFGFNFRSKEISKKYQHPVTVGENVHYNNSLKIAAQIAVVKWLSSRKHLENIESDFVLTGIGVIQSTSGGFYFTQLFLGY